jgi:eukaryotic-like serine/threonine-protein kinase
MGEVFLAFDKQLQRKVALKLLPESFATDKERLRRFEREAIAASALNHPNVAHIYEVAHFEGQHFIAMEYVEGISLQTWIGQKVEPSKVRDVALQLADALEEAHTKGIIHRDLKPSNIMLNQRGQIKVLDFGLAKIIQQSNGASFLETQTVTETGTLLGTVPYMSPEQALGKTIDHRSDIFSFGTILYTLLSGKHPFQGATQMESLDKVLHAQPEPLTQTNASIGRYIERMIHKCLEKDVTLRYQSFHEILEDLRNGTRQSTPTEIISPAFKNKRILRSIWLVLLLVAGAAALFSLFVKRNTQTDKGPVRTTLAVMPFHIVTPEQEISYLSIGIPDAIITRLSNLQQIQLRPTSSILSFQNKPFDLKEVEKKLNVQNVLAGTIQKAGKQFRIRVQLIRTVDGVSLWGETYDLTPSDLLSIEDSVSDRVSSALKIQISPEQKERLHQVFTSNAEAYEWYLRGREQLLRYTKEAALNAISCFEKGLQIDPTFAKAQAGLAQAAADLHIRFAR